MANSWAGDTGRISGERKEEEEEESVRRGSQETQRGNRMEER